MSGKRVGETQEEAKLRRNQIVFMPWPTVEELKDERVHPWGRYPQGLKREDFEFHDAKSSIKMMMISGICL
jgi:hypothetical protein